MQQVLTSFSLNVDTGTFFLKNFEDLMMAFKGGVMHSRDTIFILGIKEFVHEHDRIIGINLRQVAIHVVYILFEELGSVKKGALMEGSVILFVEDVCQIQEILVLIQERDDLLVALSREDELLLDLELGHFKDSAKNGRFIL